jgi:hypothetical protein
MRQMKLGYSGHAADAAVWGEVTFIRDASLAAFQSLQPRVTVVEGLRSRNGIASISNPGTLDAECTTMPMSVSTRSRHAVHMMRCHTNLTRRVLTCRVTALAGTPWCQGAPTYWVTGHQIDNERPRCLWDGSWVVSNSTELNNTKDRHACVNMDVNRDGYDDLVCKVGAHKGMGEGYNEVFLTEPSGSTVQLLGKSDDNKTGPTRASALCNNRFRSRAMTTS